MNMRLWIAAIAACLLMAPVDAIAAPLAAPDAEARCQALAATDLSALPDAPTKVDAARTVAATADLPAFCQVTATIQPKVGIELRLPIDWNGKFFEYARGGYCRPIEMTDCNTPLRKGYACVITDHGNKTTKQDDDWAGEDTQAKVDCGFRATHAAAVAGKALTAAFYKTPPRWSYLMGCSTGGRLAMTEASRFPYDFDGIIAGAPPVSKYLNGLSLAWNALAPLDAQGNQILFPDDIRVLAAAVLARCDADDGIADGVVGDPHACRFDVATLKLAPQKIAAIRKIYAGPVTSTGRPLYNAAPLFGSELNWIGTFVPEAGKPSPIRASSNAAFRNIVQPILPANWDITALNWDEDYKRVYTAEAYASAANPDLRPFKARGGKLIAYHGLTDQLVLADNYADYYQAVERVMGGPAQTRDFFRLFQSPGLNHCTGGAGATVVDYIAALEAWVERGEAPAQLTAYKLKDPSRAGRLPVDPANVAWTRPVYPYPNLPRYKGGDPALASSFRPAASGAR